METTAQKLQKIVDTKAGIKQAIIDKGVAVASSDSFASYPEKIRQIGGGPTETFSAFYNARATIVNVGPEHAVIVAMITDGRYLFYGLSPAIKTWKADMPNLVNGHSMFREIGTLFTTFEGELPNLEVIDYMFYSQGLTRIVTYLPKIEIFPTSAFYPYIAYFEADMPNFKNGTNAFSGKTYLATFKSKLPKLENGYRMFYRSSISGVAMVFDVPELPVLTSAEEMFYYGRFTSWTLPLPVLSNGKGMFFYNNLLTAWTVALPELTDGTSMFYYTTSLTSWNVALPKLTNGTSMFYYSGLTAWNIPLPELANGSSMFGYSKLSAWTMNIPKLTNATSMFNGASIQTFDASFPLVNNMQNMFYNCGSLKSVSGLDTSKVTSFQNTFFGCAKLESVQALDASAVTSATGFNTMFSGSYPNFTDFGGLLNANWGFNLSMCTALTRESLLNVLNGLKDRTGTTAQTCTLGATNLAKLTAADKLIATNKNWNLA